MVAWGGGGDYQDATPQSLLPSTLAGLGWPPNAGPPLRLPRRLACGVPGGGGVSEDLSRDELRGSIPRWLNTGSGHLYRVPPLDVVFTAWEPDPFRQASAVIAYAPEQSKRALLKAMRELQRLGVSQIAEEHDALQTIEQQYWLDQAEKERINRRDAEKQGRPFEPDNALPPDFGRTPEMQAWHRWKTAAKIIRSQGEAKVKGDLMTGTLVAFGEPARIGAHPEWITPPTWMELDPDESSPGKFVGGGNTYWRVRVMRFSGVLAIQPKVQEATKESLPTPTKKPRKGGLDYAIADAPLVAEAISRVDSGENAWVVAQDLALRARGSTRGYSKAQRLHGRIKARLRERASGQESVQPPFSPEHYAKD